MTDKSRYAQAGVDIEAGNRLVEKMKSVVGSTHTPSVMSNIGGFGGLFHLNADQFRKPILVSSTDGVGTKIKVACLMDKHDTIGIDLVAMCVNDIAVSGAKPLFFLDYIAMSRLDEGKILDIISGIAEGCNQASAALIGGETAELPDTYPPGEYDLVGFVVGVIDDEKIIDGSGIRVGDVVIGLSSSGIHSNGFSLVRKIFLEEQGLSLDARLDGLDGTLGEVLIKPTKIYVEAIRSLIRDLPVAGMAHITGGGLTDNIPRMLPQACAVEIDLGSWEVPRIFKYLEEMGRVEKSEMLRAFNNGIGLAIVVPEEAAEDTLLRLQGLEEPAWTIGRIVARQDDQPVVKYI